MGFAQTVRNKTEILFNSCPLNPRALFAFKSRDDGDSKQAERNQSDPARGEGEDTSRCEVCYVCLKTRLDLAIDAAHAQTCRHNLTTHTSSRRRRRRGSPPTFRCCSPSASIKFLLLHTIASFLHRNIISDRLSALLLNQGPEPEPKETTTGFLTGRTGSSDSSGRHSGCTNSVRRRPVFRGNSRSPYLTFPHTQLTHASGYRCLR